MSPPIDFPPDLLGMFKQQASPVPASAAADLETLYSALDLLQAGGQSDLNALTGCLSRLSDWLKNLPEAAPGNKSGWTSERFGVKGMGGMITCRSALRELIFNHDGSGQPYMGLWHSRAAGEASGGGSFKIQSSDGGAMLLLEGSRPLQVSLPLLGAAAWGSIDAFYQGLNASRQPNQPAAASTQPPTVQVPPAAPSTPSLPEKEHTWDASSTIVSRPAKRPIPAAPTPSGESGRTPLPGEQPAAIDPKIWLCACGRENASLFCTECGRGKPAPSVEQRAAAQPARCRQCGGPVPISARFCRSCGTEVKG